MINKPQPSKVHYFRDAETERPRCGLRRRGVHQRTFEISETTCHNCLQLLAWSWADEGSDVADGAARRIEELTST